MEAGKPMTALGLAILLVVAMAEPSSVYACEQTLETFMPCLPAVEGSSPPLPDDACCGIVRKADSACLCSTFGSGNYAGINVQAALNLAKNCQRPVPTGSTCGKYPVPSGAPYTRKLK